MFGRSHARCFAHTLLLLATLGAVAFGVLIGDDDAPDVLARLAKIPQQARRVVLKEDHSASPTTAEPPLDTPTTATPPLEGRKAKLAVEGRTTAKIVPSEVIRIEAEKEVAKRAKSLADDETSAEKQRIKEHQDAQAKLAEMRKARMVAEQEVDALVKAQVEAESKVLAHVEANVKAANMIAVHSDGKMKADVQVSEATKKKEAAMISATQAVEAENHSLSRSPLQKLRDTLDPEVPTVADELRRILQVTATPCVNSSATSSPPHSESTSADTTSAPNATTTFIVRKDESEWEWIPGTNESSTTSRLVPTSPRPIGDRLKTTTSQADVVIDGPDETTGTTYRDPKIPLEEDEPDETSVDDSPPSVSTTEIDDRSTSSSEASTTSTIEPTTVKVSMTVQNVDYLALTNDAALTAAFKTSCATEIAKSSDVHPDDVVVVLSPGSVHVDAEVAVTNADEALAIESKLLGSSTLGADVATSLSSVGGIDSVSSGPIKASGVTVSESPSPLVFTTSTVPASTKATNSTSEEDDIDANASPLVKVMHAVEKTEEAILKGMEVSAPFLAWETPLGVTVFVLIQLVLCLALCLCCKGRAWDIR